MTSGWRYPATTDPSNVPRRRTRRLRLRKGSRSETSWLRPQPQPDFDRRKRMMGVEPTTFCMANASDLSRPFAPVRSNRRFAGSPSTRANGSEPERTTSVTIVTTRPTPVRSNHSAPFASASPRGSRTNSPDHGVVSTHHRSAAPAPPPPSGVARFRNGSRCSRRGPGGRPRVRGRGRPRRRSGRRHGRARRRCPRRRRPRGCRGRRRR